MVYPGVKLGFMRFMVYEKSEPLSTEFSAQEFIKVVTFFFWDTQSCKDCSWEDLLQLKFYVLFFSPVFSWCVKKNVFMYSAFWLNSLLNEEH